MTENERRGSRAPANTAQEPNLLTQCQLTQCQLTGDRGARCRSAGAPFATLACVAVLSGCAVEQDPSPASASGLRLNDIQVIGSHNSYKLAMSPDRFESLQSTNPEVALSLDYEHVSLEEQLDMGLRILELDVFYDPTGEHYTWPEGEQPAGGFRVMHVQDLDDRSHCSTLRRCLETLDSWSVRSPDHLPVVVTVNAKDQQIDQPGFVVPLPFSAQAWDDLDAVVQEKLGSKLMTPTSVATDAGPMWPSLDAARGRFLFVLDEGGEKRDSYLARERDAAFFANLPAEHPQAAFLIVNNPVADFDRIQSLVREGFLVRTRADADTEEARTGNTERRDRAFASGAQFISTDYYLPAKFGTGYVVELPNGQAARCNPVRLGIDSSAPDCEIDL